MILPRSPVCAAAMIVAVSCIASAVSATPVPNGNFDETTHYLPPEHPLYGDPEYDPLQPTGWTPSPYGSFPGVDFSLMFQDGAYVAPASQFGGFSDGGNNVLALRNRGYASTRFFLPAQQTITLSWIEASRVTGEPTDPLASYQVFWNGAIAGEFTPVVGEDFAMRSLSLQTAYAGSTDLAFVGLNLGEIFYFGGFDQYVGIKSIHTVLIDDVQWSLSPVPEPSGVILMLVGLSAMTGRRVSPWWKAKQ